MKEPTLKAKAEREVVGMSGQTVRMGGPATRDLTRAKKAAQTKTPTKGETGD